MWQNSIELLEYALRELQTAVESNKTSVEIMLDEYFLGDMERIKEIVDNLKLKEITATLLEKFNDYEIKSRVGQDGCFKAILTFKNAPCAIFYPLKWNLILKIKAE